MNARRSCLPSTPEVFDVSRSRRRPAQVPGWAISDHTILTFTRTELSTGRKCPPKLIDPVARCGRLMCASLFECRSDVGPGGVRAAGHAGRDRPGARPDAKGPRWASGRTSELPRVHRAGDGWWTAAASPRASLPAAGWQLADHAEYARLATTGLHAAPTGDLYVSVHRPLLLLVGSLVLWDVALCRRSGFPFPSPRWVPPWRLAWGFPARRFSRRPEVNVRRCCVPTSRGICLQILAMCAHLSRRRREVH
jgi:hypothetical protein